MSDLASLWDSEAVGAAAEALGDRPAWIVGGAVRDALLGRSVTDVDLAVADGEEEAARRIGSRVRGAVFPLSREFGSWRVQGPGFHLDVTRLRGPDLESDLRLRDFTVNAIAVPLAGGRTVDPLGGLADLERSVLRAAGPTSFESDPLRILRAARLAAQLELEPDEGTVKAARRSAARAGEPAGERLFSELRAIVAGPDPLRGIALMDQLGAMAGVLPEFEAMRGVEQSPYHHLDVRDHTLDVLTRVLELERDPEPALGEAAGDVTSLLAEPLSDELTRGGALRLGALFHDIAKPGTRDVTPEGRITFIGHDSVGEGVVANVLGERFRVSRTLVRHVGALTRHHLRLGFLLHERPLSRRAVYAYMRATDPVPVDVTVLSVADRLATRGERTRRSWIDAHLELAREVLGPALVWHRDGPPDPPVRGDELCRELGLEPGPEVGRILEELRAARYAGEAETRDEALALARSLTAGRP